MARTNYSFEKRQRELAKKRKKEEKAAKKAAGGGEDEMNPNEAALALASQAADADTEAGDDAEAADDAGEDSGHAPGGAPALGLSQIEPPASPLCWPQGTCLVSMNTFQRSYER